LLSKADMSTYPSAIKGEKAKRSCVILYKICIE
jgi:hypothetical protein